MMHDQFEVKCCDHVMHKQNRYGLANGRAGRRTVGRARGQAEERADGAGGRAGGKRERD